VEHMSRVPRGAVVPAGPPKGPVPVPARSIL